MVGRKIVVVDGRLRYRILEPVLEEIELGPESAGVVEPTVRHEVAPVGAVRFYVEFSGSFFSVRRGRDQIS